MSGAIEPREEPVMTHTPTLRPIEGTFAAEALGISRATANRHWRYAKIWLYCALHGDGKPPAGAGDSEKKSWA